MKELAQIHTFDKRFDKIATTIDFEKKVFDMTLKMNKTLIPKKDD